ncbi:MAG TPA: glutamyl-tRNA reductase [Actinomycetota bacterium]|nr:glutamyl-tRNA reductase [Actinomycetota bacterium]
MPILALGVSYRRASVEVLEQLALDDDDLAKAYHHLTAMPSVEEAVLLSTCNRVEVYAAVEGYHTGFQDLKRFLSESRGVDPEDFAEPLYSHYEDHTAEHLFSVAAGLDSMVVGEPQILSQVRQAFQRARTEEACGPQLSSLFRYAIRAGRRARAETRIGASPTAFVEAGGAAAERHLGGLSGRSVLVIGAGEMAALALGWLRHQGVGEVAVLNRTPEKAERLAARVGGRHGGLERLPEALAAADLVVSSTTATRPVIGVEDVQRAAADRRLFLLDLAVPRDVDPSAREVPGVRVADIDDLRDVLAASREGIAAEVEAAGEVIAQETRKFVTQRRAAKLAPLIAALHERGERVRAAELERLASRLSSLSEREREAVEALTTGIVKTLLHDPVVELKERWGAGVGEAHARVLAELFGLEPPTD